LDDNGKTLRWRREIAAPKAERRPMREESMIGRHFLWRDGANHGRVCPDHSAFGVRPAASDAPLAPRLRHVFGRTDPLNAFRQKKVNPLAVEREVSLNCGSATGPSTMSKPLNSTVLTYLRDLVAHRADGASADADLIARFVARRDQGAFALLAKRHGPLVMGVCRRVLRNEHDAEDALQATFLVLAGKAKSLGTRDSVAGWLFRVARNVSLRHLRDAARRRKHEAAAARGVPPIAPGEPLLDDLLAVVDEEVAGLPPKHRAALVLCCIQGKTREEAAHALGWPLGTVHCRLERGKRQLQGRLRRRGVVASVAVAAWLSRVGKAAAATPRLSGFALDAGLHGSGLPGAVAASPQAGRLAAEFLRGMLWTQARRAALLVAAVCLVGGVVTAGVAANPAGNRSAPPVDPGATSLNVATPWPPPNDPAPDAQSTDDAPKERLTATVVHHLDGHRVAAYALAWSADGTHIVSGGNDSTVCLWEAQTGKGIKRINSPVNQCYVAAISLDGTRAAFAGGGSHSEVVDLNSYDVRACDAHDFAPTPQGASYGSIAFSPDGKKFAVGGCWDASIWIWDAETGTELAKLSAHREAVVGLAWTKDDRLISVGTDGDLCIRSLASLDPPAIIDTKLKSVSSMVLSPDERQALFVSKETVLLLDLTTGEPVCTYTMDSGFVPYRLAFSPDGKRFAAASDGGVHLFDVASGDELGRFCEADSKIRGVVWSPDGRRIATSGAGGDCVVRVWEIQMVK
jgi:RNA polymerase sigma factor (sigma-70 family)